MTAKLRHCQSTSNSRESNSLTEREREGELKRSWPLATSVMNENKQKLNSSRTVPTLLAPVACQLQQLFLCSHSVHSLSPSVSLSLCLAHSLSFNWLAHTLHHSSSLLSFLRYHAHCCYCFYIYIAISLCKTRAICLASFGAAQQQWRM